MTTKHYLIIALVGLVTFVAGFLVANRINRSEFDKIRGELENIKSQTQPQNAQQTASDLTSAEIDTKIAEADASPQNFNFQKGLGIALYRYGASKEDVSIIEKSIKLLERANSIDASDNDVLVALGNSHFDIGYFKKQNEAFVKGREYYEKVVNARPQDVELQTDLGLTYLLVQPPDLEKAASEFERSLAVDPKHEKTLQYYAQTLAKQGNTAKANEVIERLRAVNPQNPTIGELTALVNAPSKDK
ncbi:MAG: tetratricopeptide repeat protein [Pyrinomonadaceae bacterium]